ncbi:hypothetical protein SADUNF_Sadunf09G0059800 [Salix dunnii]|uniref:Uncharacterized protein n=1 Tax=Salix dunnii TaxID=1413687 RepID=A0A835JUC2_9ROSI|nr:hypothetical protein SADUNF_Sadunf09G0059800 [Salix dunnii]
MKNMAVDLPCYSWQSMYNPIEEVGLFYGNSDVQFGSYPEDSSLCISIKDFSDVSSSIPISPASLSFNVDDLPVTMSQPEEQGYSLIPESNFTFDDPLMVREIGEINDWLASENRGALQDFPGDDAGNLLASPSLREASIDTLTNQTSLILPGTGMELDNKLMILHLLKAYGEAAEMEMKELAEKIMSRLKEMACPIGSTLERLAYYLIQAREGEVDFLWQEASKNYEAAFKAFYQIFPYGRFAHFTANSVILEAIPEEADIVHIVDFDIGQGVQWPPVIETLARLGKRMVRLTAIKWEEEEDCGGVGSARRFEETKMRLYEHAHIFGLRLKMEEMDMEVLVSEMKKTKKRGGRSEWLAFNCMAGLPHMGTGRSARSLGEFLRLAKDSVTINTDGGIGTRGTITIGDGIGWGMEMKEQKGYGSVFEGQLVQFLALIESLDCHFPDHLREARIAIECVFLIPYFSSSTDLQMWDDIAKERKALSGLGLVARQMREDNLLEARELIRESKRFYSVNIEGVKENEMVLSYMEVPLVKVSSWT